MNYYNNNDDIGCLGCGLVAAIYIAWAAFSISVIAGLIWLTIYLLQQAGAFG